MKGDEKMTKYSVIQREKFPSGNLSDVHHIADDLSFDDAFTKARNWVDGEVVDTVILNGCVQIRSKFYNSEGQFIFWQKTTVVSRDLL